MQLGEGRSLEPFKVQLFEAKAGDPKVPQGKPFAVLATTDLGLPEASKVTCKTPLQAAQQLQIISSLIAEQRQCCAHEF